MPQTKSWDQVAGKWKRLTGEVKKKWSSLTDDELIQVNGRREVLANKIQERYGIAKEEVEKQIDEWVNKLKI